MDIIYLDHAATSPMPNEVLASMLPYYMDKELFMNPSASYANERIKKKLEESREIIAGTLNANPDEIFFTSGGSESDNWALNGWSESNPNGFLIASAIEHGAVLNTHKHLLSKGRSGDIIGVDKGGFVDVERLSYMVGIQPFPILVAVMGANNEIGAIQPLSEIGEIIAEKRESMRGANSVLFSDCVQLYGHTKLRPKELGVHLLSASAHKFGGPKGIGFLYIDKNVQDQMQPFIRGGHQESNFRAGTENVPEIIGMATAAKLAHDNLEAKVAIEKQLVDRLWSKISQSITGVHINGSTHNRLSNNLNVRFDGINSASLLRSLADLGVCVSAGSACNSGNPAPSHVLKAIGLSDEEASSSLRFTVGAENTFNEIDCVVEILKASIEMLRINL